MATRHQRFAPVAEYQPYNLSAATVGTNGVAVGTLFATTSTTAVGAAGSATITLAAFSPLLVVGQAVYIFGGTGAGELVTVTATAAATPSLTAVFANTHSGTYSIVLTHGTKVGTVNFGALGTTMSLVLWNGLPDLAAAIPPAKKIATITPAAVSYVLNCAADQGLFITYTGTTAGDVTITYLTDPI